MKRIATIALLSVVQFVQFASAQNTPTPQDATASTLRLLLQQPPTKVTFAQTTLVGNPGPRTLYYWIVTNNTAGASSPSGPFTITNAANALSGSNGVTLSWLSVPGASSYDVLRTSTPSQPSGACACAVATAVSGASTTDQSESLSAYTVSALDPGSLTLTLNNEAVSLGSSHMVVRQGGTPIADLTYPGLAAMRVVGSAQYPTIAAAVAGGSTGYVYIPSGAFSLTSTIALGGKTSFTLWAAPDAVITAAAGLGANPMFSIQGGSNTSDVHVIGGDWNANSIASSCGLVNATSAGGPVNTEVAWIKCRNTTGIGLQGGNSAPLATTNGFIGLNVHDNKFSNIGAHGINISGVDSLTLQNNFVDGTVDGDGIKLQQSVNVNASGNDIRNYRFISVNGGSGLECVFCTAVSFTGNNIWNVGATAANARNGIYFDTVIGGTASGNTIIGTGGHGIRVEKPRNVSVTGNSVQDTIGNGIFADHVSDYQQKQPLDVTTGMTAGTGVTLSADAALKQEGAASLKAIIGGGFTTGNMWFYDFGSSQTWTSSSVNYPMYEFWFQTDTALEAGVLSFAISPNADFSNPHTVLTLPRLVASQWIRIQVYDPVRWLSKQAGNIRTIGIIANSNPGTPTLHFDDLGINTTGDNLTITGNTVLRTQGFGIDLEHTMTNWTISGNTLLDIGYGTALANPANAIQINPNGASDSLTAGVINGNTVSYSSSNLFTVAQASRGVRLQTSGGGTIDNVKITNNILHNNVLTPLFFDSTGVTNVSTANNQLGTSEGDTNRFTSIEASSNTGSATRASAYLQGPATAGNSFARLWLGNMRWDSASSLWKVPDQGSGANDVAGMEVTNNSGIKFYFIPSDAGGAKTFTDATLQASLKLTIGNTSSSFATTLSAPGITSSGSNSLSMDGAAGTNRQLVWTTAAVGRWIMRANGTAEGGSNAGSDLEIVARDDSGALLSTPLTITRSTGIIGIGVGMKSQNLLLSTTAPTIATHFNTSGDSITTNGTGAFKVTVGTGTAGSTGSVTLPTAANGWACHLYNQTRGAYIQQTANTATTATFTNYGTTVGTPVNWTNSDVLVGGCVAF